MAKSKRDDSIPGSPSGRPKPKTPVSQPKPVNEIGSPKEKAKEVEQFSRQQSGRDKRPKDRKQDREK